MDEQGLDKVWLYPTLGMIYEQLLKHDPEGVGIMFRAFNRWLEDDWTLQLREVGSSRRPTSRWPTSTSRWRSWTERSRSVRTTVCMRPAAPTTVFGPLTPGDPYFDPVLGARQRGRHHRRRARRRQRLLAQRIREGRVLGRVLGWRSPERSA